MLPPDCAADFLFFLLELRHRFVVFFFVCESETEGAHNYPLAVARRPVSRARPRSERLKVSGLIGARGRITCSNHLLAAPAAAERIHFMGDIPLPSF